MDFCYKTASIWQIVGNIIFIIKIVIPLLIIILASIELGKAVVSNDDKAISKAASKLLKRVVLGICIFFIPTIIRLIFNMITNFNDEMKNDYNNCVECLTNPKDCDTTYEGEIFR